MSKTTHFLSVFCEAGVVQQCPEAQAGMVQDGLRNMCLTKLKRATIWHLNTQVCMKKTDYK